MTLSRRPDDNRILDLSEVFPRISYDLRYLKINEYTFDTLDGSGSNGYGLSCTPVGECDNDYIYNMAVDWVETFSTTMKEALK